MIIDRYPNEYMLERLSSISMPPLPLSLFCNRKIYAFAYLRNCSVSGGSTRRCLRRQQHTRHRGLRVLEAVEHKLEVGGGSKADLAAAAAAASIVHDHRVGRLQIVGAHNQRHREEEREGKRREGKGRKRARCVVHGRFTSNLLMCFEWLVGRPISRSESSRGGVVGDLDPMDGAWMDHGWAMGVAWIQSGLAMDAVWTDHGCSLDRSWMQSGPIMDGWMDGWMDGPPERSKL